MRETTERLSPGRDGTVEELVIEAMHRFAYTLVSEYADPQASVLEVGFGEGYGSEIVEPWIAAYVGVEVDHDAVEHALAKYGSTRVSFRHYDGKTLPFGDESFDIVMAFQVLEHVPDPEAFLRETRRVTRPGEPVLVVTPNRSHRLAPGQRPWNRYHLREYSSPELADVMRSVFPVVELSGIVGSPEMNEIEKRRVARARRLARLDPLGLRYVLHEDLDTRLRAFLRWRSSGTQHASGLPIGVEHVRRTSEEIASSLDLLAIGRA